jgi:uncharacterized cupin superfamily protein
MSSYHYLYRITNIIENRHYYGSRTCHKITPQEDLGIRYFSSSTDKDFIRDQKQNPQNYRYKVIIITKTRKKATALEQKIQQYFDVGKNITFYNKAIQTSKNYCTAGRVTAKNMLGNIMSISKDDPRYLSGELFSIMKGIVTVKDKEGSILHVLLDDPRYKSGELLHILKGTVFVKDKNGSRFSVSINDPRYLSGELVYFMKENVVVKDKNGNTMSVSKDDPRYLSGELFSITKGKVVVKDQSKNIMLISKDDPRYISGELVGVNKGLKMPNGHQVGKNNSQFGTIWIYNLELKLSKTIKKEELPEYVSLGWLKGRKMNFF